MATQKIFWTEVQDEGIWGRYCIDPTNDRELRDHCGIPDNAYYTASIWIKAGVVHVDRFTRVVPLKKISKSTI